MMKFIVMFLAVTAFLKVQAKDCDDYDDRIKNINMADCCRNIFAEPDPSKYSNCNGDSDCDQATCILKTENVFVDDRVNKNEAINFFMKSTSSRSLRPVVIKNLGTCIKLLKTAECKPNFFIACIRVMAFAECPDSEWTNSDICMEAKNYMQLCGLHDK